MHNVHCTSFLPAGDPSRQKGGTLPVGHVHLNPPPVKAVHVPPFRHGLLAHTADAAVWGTVVVVAAAAAVVVAKADASQCTPVTPDGHAQTGFPTTTTHTPLLTQ